MLNSFKLVLKSNYQIFKGIRRLLSVAGFFEQKANAVTDEFWSGRIEQVLQCPDNEKIRRVPNAGLIEGDTQMMHNGVRIHVGSYYGDGNTVLLWRNKGVHEPQEEKVFEEILEYLPSNATMLELGAFWAFYSMSFQRKIRSGTNYLIEPDPHALLSGKHNFRLNGFTGHFFNYGISDTCEAKPGMTPTITVDQFLTDQKIGHLHILHSDIQGYELKMLSGAKNNLQAGNIDYVFISTHSNELHESCKSFLVEMDYQILCDANLDETFSWDGLIVAKHSRISTPETLSISKRK